jgi:hypothetical protein
MKLVTKAFFANRRGVEGHYVVGGFVDTDELGVPELNLEWMTPAQARKLADKLRVAALEAEMMDLLKEAKK